MSRRYAAPEAPVLVPSMREQLVDQLMIHLLRNPQVLGYALPDKAIQADHFIREPEYRMLWPCIVAQNKIYGIGSVPFAAMFQAALDQADMSVEALTDAQFYHVFGVPKSVEDKKSLSLGILYYAYHEATEDELHKQYGLELLRRFLQERQVSYEAQRKFVSVGQMVPGDLEAYSMQIMGHLSHIKSIGERVAYDPSSEDFVTAAVDVRSTGLDFFDNAMNGGHAPGEGYLCYGPQKGGKTLISTQLVCAGGELAHMATQRGEEPTYSYYFTYEEPPEELLNRFFSCGASILWNRLQYEIKLASDYSRTGKLLPYEHEMYRARGVNGGGAGEWERLQAWKQRAGKYTRIFDMTRRSNAAIGGGGVSEIVAILQAELAEGHKPGVVVIDYLNKAVGNMITAQNRDYAETRQLTVSFVCEAISFVASPFQCPVWLMNQYDATAQSKRAATKMSSADGAEAKTLGANVNFAFCLGNRDLQSNVAILAVDRARRSPTQGHEVHLFFNGDFSRWENVSGRFESNEVTGTITSKAQSAITAGISAEAMAAFAVPPAPAQDPFQAERAFEAGDMDKANW